MATDEKGRVDLTKKIGLRLRDVRIGQGDRAHGCEGKRWETVMIRRLALLFAVLLALAGNARAETLSGRVVRIIDGDTLVLLIAGNVQERVRLTGIDCPERGQAFGTKAKEALSGRVAGETVTVEWDKRDRYKRIVGKVIDGQGDTNLSLVRSGMCWWYHKYAHEQSPEDQSLYEEAEETARGERKGLWRDPHPVPPWEWRKR